MRRLEEVYLANVILYVRSIETIVKLIQVNKKCHDAMKIIRYYSLRKLHENEEDFMSYVIVKNMFDLFPNIETIRCRKEDINVNLEIFNQVNQIELDSFESDEIHLTQEIEDKVIILNVKSVSLGNIKLNEFPNVRRVKVNYFEERNLKEFLGDNQLQLKQLIIQTEDKKELEIIKEYNNIDHKIIKLNNKITQERYIQLNQFAKVYSQYPIDGIDIENTMFSIGNNIIISNQDYVNRLYDLTLFKKCQIECDCDLRNCELLEEITTSYYKRNKPEIQIKGLQHLKKIEYIKKVDCIPSSVTKMIFSTILNYKELLENDKYCFGNIKEIFFNTYYERNNGYSGLLSNFYNCTKIHLYNGNSSSDPFELPMSVKELLINQCEDVNQIEEIVKVKGLKRLGVNFNLNENKNEIESMYGKLKELEWLKTNWIEGIKLPSNVTCLEYDVKENTDLSQYTQLKEIQIYCYSYNQNEIKLPNKLKKLTINGNVRVVNSNEIESDRIILDNTSSQLCEWKSMNIHILRQFDGK